MALDVPAVVAATTAGLLFAVANNLQSSVASAVPIDSGGTFRLFAHLVRRPRWLVGAVLAALALALQVVALARGGVILVQALLSAGLVVALAIESLRERRPMRPGEITGSLLLVAGVTVLLGYARPGAGHGTGWRGQLAAVLVLALMVAIGFGASAAHRWPHVSAGVMGAVGGVCFALDAVFLKGMAIGASREMLQKAAVALALFAAASAFGNLIVQRAYQRAPLRVALPAVSAADPIAAFLIGRYLLGEHLRPGHGPLVAAWIGIVMIGVGVVITTTSGPSRAGDPAIAR